MAIFRINDDDGYFMCMCCQSSVIMSVVPTTSTLNDAFSFILKLKMCENMLLKPDSLLTKPSESFLNCDGAEVMSSDNFSHNYDGKYVSPARYYAKRHGIKYNTKADLEWAVAIVALEACAGKSVYDLGFDKDNFDLYDARTPKEKQLQVHLNDNLWNHCSKDKALRSLIMKKLRGSFSIKKEDPVLPLHEPKDLVQEELVPEKMTRSSPTSSQQRVELSEPVIENIVPEAVTYRTVHNVIDTPNSCEWLNRVSGYGDEGIFVMHMCRTAKRAFSSSSSSNSLEKKNIMVSVSSIVKDLLVMIESTQRGYEISKSYDLKYFTTFGKNMKSTCNKNSQPGSPKNSSAGNSCVKATALYAYTGETGAALHQVRSLNLPHLMAKQLEFVGCDWNASDFVTNDMKKNCNSEHGTYIQNVVDIINTCKVSDTFESFRSCFDTRLNKMPEAKKWWNLPPLFNGGSESEENATFNMYSVQSLRF